MANSEAFRTEVISQNDVADILIGRVGLIIGAGATVSERVYQDLADTLWEQAEQYAWNPRQLGDELRTDRGNAEEALQIFRDEYGKLKSSPFLPDFAKPNWRAIVSIAMDNYLEEEISDQLSRVPARTAVTQIVDLEESYPPRSVPHFKLLGAFNRHCATIFTEDYLLRRELWKPCLSAFCDRLQGNPALCLGLASDESAAMDLLTMVVSNRNTRPSALIFMYDDPLLQSDVVIRLLANRVRLYAYKDSLSSLAAKIQASDRMTGSTHRPVVSGAQVLDRYRDVFVYLQHEQRDRISSTARKLLLDLLFSPAVGDWHPFEYDYDFRRTAEKKLIQVVRNALADNKSDANAVIVSGSAATGKSILLKRVALELSKSPIPVVWASQTVVDAPDRVFAEYFKHLRSVVPDCENLLVVIDDPIRSHRSEVETILSHAVALRFRPTLLAGVRSSDWLTLESRDVVGRAVVAAEVVLDDAFDADELSRLGPYLVKIGAVESDEEGQRVVEQVATQAARDVLSMLYVLVPETRPAILAGVRDEYLRLCNAEGVRKVAIGARMYSSEPVQRAYEMACVADMYRCDLPFSIVRAVLDIEWTEASDLLSSHSAIWGILYPVESQYDTLLRPRNEIVSETIVELLNSGLFSRRGEHRVLLEMVRACRGRSEATYHRFIRSLLVGNPQLKRLNYADGLELYDEAIKALPVPDKTLVHHKGIWERVSGGLASKSLETFQEALRTPNYPYAEDAEREQNIYVSMASAVLTEVKEGVKSLPEGKRQATEYLALARKDGTLDAHGTHVSSGVSYELIKQLEATDAIDKVHIASLAISDIDSISIMQNSPLTHRRLSAKSNELLNDIRAKLLGEVLGDDGHAAARALWEGDKCQLGFAIYARQRLNQIRNSERPKGSHYHELFMYCEEAMEQIVKSRESIDPGLASVQAEVFYWWRVYRAMHSPLDAEIDWKKFLSLLDIARAPGRVAKNHLFDFFRALSLAHLGHWNAADEIFTDMRRAELPADVLWLPRAYLLNPQGGKKLLQGTIRDAAGRLYLDVETLGQAFMTERRDRWSRAGEFDHGHVMFMFGGTRAVRD